MSRTLEGPLLAAVAFLDVADDVGGVLREERRLYELSDLFVDALGVVHITKRTGVIRMFEFLVNFLLVFLFLLHLIIKKVS